MERQIPDTKRCAHCDQALPASAFRPNAKMRTGLDSYCRECSGAKSAEWRARNAERVRELEVNRRPRTTNERWTAYLKREYQMTVEAYWEMNRAQDGRCAICRESEPGKRGLLHVDHDHETGRVRGLLCHRCNVALGHFRDRVNLLEAAIVYLKGSLHADPEAADAVENP